MSFVGIKDWSFCRLSSFGGLIFSRSCCVVNRLTIAIANSSGLFMINSLGWIIACWALCRGSVLVSCLS